MQRRAFLTSGTTAALGFLGLRNYLSAAPAAAASRVIEPYGPLIPDPKGILDLPKGFHYQVLSEVGQPMSDGFKVPGAPDGMACFEGRDGTVVLVRNHEMGMNLDNSPFPEVGKYPEELDRNASYDAGPQRNDRPYIGGTTNVVYDPNSGEVLRQFLSLTGTDRNCAGGAMPWGSWITCEEPGDMASRRGRNHGFCFEVKASDDGKLQKPVPLKALGRFRHEAVALDPRTGILYLTEDQGDGLLYRFVPDRERDFTKGKLQALQINGEKGADLTNNVGSPKELTEGDTFGARWITMSRVDSDEDDLRHRGHRKGAAKFARGEGIIYSRGSLFVCCTSGGKEKQGQIWQLEPSTSKSSPDKLTLFLEPKESDLLTNCDNVCAAPWGDLILCEDLIAEHLGKTPHVRGVTPEGEVYTIARNAKAPTEFAGSCFSPDGKVLFVNMQGEGLTLAIHGPFEEGRKV